MSKNFYCIPVTKSTKLEIDKAKEWYRIGHPDDNRPITYDFICLRMALVYRGKI